MIPEELAVKLLDYITNEVNEDDESHLATEGNIFYFDGEQYEELVGLAHQLCQSF